MTRTFAFAEVKPTRRFEKSFGKLTPAAQAQCRDALRQLLVTPLAPGLRMKPIRPNNVYYEARINQGDRLIVYPINDTAHVMDVVTHDDIAKWGNEKAPG